MSILDDIKQQYKYGGINQKLIFWNIGLFLLSLIFFYKFKGGFFLYPDWLALSSDYTTSLPFFWTFITYSFLHGGIFHLLFNLIVLNFAGRLFLTFFSEKQLLGVYLLGAIFSGLIYVLAYTLTPELNNAILVGASASVMAILFATVSYSPLMTVRLLLIGYVKLWHIAAVIVVLDILQIGLNNTGGHISHLAGALFGFIFVLLLRQGTDLTKIVSKTTDLFTKDNKRKKSYKKYTPFKKVHINKQPTYSSKPNKSKNQQQIDEILDKISRSGYDSLTKEEKEFLFRQK